MTDTNQPQQDELSEDRDIFVSRVMSAPPNHTDHRKELKNSLKTIYWVSGRGTDTDTVTDLFPGEIDTIMKLVDQYVEKLVGAGNKNAKPIATSKQHYVELAQEVQKIVEKEQKR